MFKFTVLDVDLKHPGMLCFSTSLFLYGKVIYYFSLGMSQGVHLNFVSWNCRDLEQFRKVKQVMNKMKDIDAKIVFLQETIIY